MPAEDQPQEIVDGACEQAALDAEAIAACLDLDAQDAAIFKAAPVLLKTARDVIDNVACERVCHAARQTMVAICERVARAMRRDCHVAGDGSIR